MISHKRIDFIMTAGRAATADVNSHTNNSTKKKATPQGLKSCEVVSLSVIYILYISVWFYPTLSSSVWFYPFLSILWYHLSPHSPEVI